MLNIRIKTHVNKICYYDSPLCSLVLIIAKAAFIEALPIILTFVYVIKLKLALGILLDKRCSVIRHWICQTIHVYFTGQKLFLVVLTETGKWLHQLTSNGLSNDIACKNSLVIIFLNLNTWRCPHFFTEKFSSLNSYHFEKQTICPCPEFLRRHIWMLKCP